MFDPDPDAAQLTFEQGRALRVKEVDDRVAETGNRRASCPRCKRAFPDPCVERNKAGELVELDAVHAVRRLRRLQGW